MLLGTGGTLLWYLLTVGRRLRYFIFSLASSGQTQTVEGFFRNARWLEREVGEMGDLWYLKKRDRRALFLVPLLYWGPLRRGFPLSGFFELRLLPGEGRIVIFHVT